jgi:hypothetical protein
MRKSTVLILPLQQGFPASDCRLSMAINGAFTLVKLLAKPNITDTVTSVHLASLANCTQMELAKASAATRVTRLVNLFKNWATF